MTSDKARGDIARIVDVKVRRHSVKVLANKDRGRGAVFRHLDEVLDVAHIVTNPFCSEVREDKTCFIGDWPDAAKSV